MLTDDSNEMFSVRKTVAVHDSVKVRVTGAIPLKVVICRVVDRSFKESLVIFKVLE